MDRNPNAARGASPLCPAIPWRLRDGRLEIVDSIADAIEGDAEAVITSAVGTGWSVQAAASSYRAWFTGIVNGAIDVAELRVELGVTATAGDLRRGGGEP